MPATRAHYKYSSIRAVHSPFVVEIGHADSDPFRPPRADADKLSPSPTCDTTISESREGPHVLKRFTPRTSNEHSASGGKASLFLQETGTWIRSCRNHQSMLSLANYLDHAEWWVWRAANCGGQRWCGKPRSCFLDANVAGRCTPYMGKGEPARLSVSLTFTSYVRPTRRSYTHSLEALYIRYTSHSFN